MEYNISMHCTGWCPPPYDEKSYQEDKEMIEWIDKGIEELFADE